MYMYIYICCQKYYFGFVLFKVWYWQSFWCIIIHLKGNAMPFVINFYSSLVCVIFTGYISQ